MSGRLHWRISAHTVVNVPSLTHHFIYVRSIAGIRIGRIDCRVAARRLACLCAPDKQRPLLDITISLSVHLLCIHLYHNCTFPSVSCLSSCVRLSIPNFINALFLSVFSFSSLPNSGALSQQIFIFHAAQYSPILDLCH